MLLGRWAVGPLGRWAVGPLGRWAVGPLGRWAVGMSVALLCAANMPVAAQAQEGGEWKVLLEVEAKGQRLTKMGTEMGRDPWKSQQNRPVPTGEWEGWRNNGYDSGSGFDAYGINGKKAALIGGQTKYFVNLRWQPWDANSPAPAPQKGAVLLETQIYISGDATGAVNIKLSDVSGKEPVALSGDYLDRNGDQRNWKHLRVDGKKLIPFANPKGKSTLRLGPFITTLSGDVLSPGVAVPTPPGDKPQKRYPESSIYSANFATVKLDDRSVSLSRVGAHDERVEGDVTHGDTTYSYTYYFGTLERQGQSDRLNTQEFVADADNMTEHEVRYGVLPHETHMVKGTDHQWSPRSDHSYAPDDWNKASFDVPYGNMNLSAYSAQPEWEGSPTGQSNKTITYTVKDNRNNEGEITVEKKYVLHFHDPLEVLWETTDAVRVNVILYDGNGIGITTPADPNGIKAGDVTVGTGTSSSTGWSVGGSLDLSFIKESLKILKLDYKYNVSNAVTVSTTSRLGFDLLPGEKAYAMVTHEYTRHHKYVYKYDQGGRNVRKGKGALDGRENPNKLKEVPHEIFADEGPTSYSPPFWMGPIGASEVPPVTPNTPPPFESTYTS